MNLWLSDKKESNGVDTPRLAIWTALLNLSWYYSELLHLKIKLKPFYFQSEFIEACSSNHSAGHPVPIQPPQMREMHLFFAFVSAWFSYHVSFFFQRHWGVPREWRKCFEKGTHLWFHFGVLQRSLPDSVCAQQHWLWEWRAREYWAVLTKD